MLGIFRPKAPLDLKEKVWTESRFVWLLKHFGIQRLRDSDEIIPNLTHLVESQLTNIR